ncbi:hypothetical protein DM867_07865 [Halosegnis rubeus]|jgi:hypothetical protein|uniref:Uncharacterized protein n=1 Tax=Halosegnis rubeus TaxID=2212850 RepID=A0A5N5U8L9_9EURY|nr:hypothetical protein [Halosegnis rubeus]KAB7515006.1 hypothetical protein DM867_07865 [Halosegnis rubeus]
MPNRGDLLEKLATESGVGLRTCLEYREGAMKFLYRREGIDGDEARDRARRLQELYRAESNPADKGGLTGHGRLRGSVHYFEDLLVLTLPADDDPTFGFSVGLDVGSDLTQFLDSCRETLFVE